MVCFLCLLGKGFLLIFLVVMYTDRGALAGSDNENDTVLPFKHLLKSGKSKHFPNIQKFFYYQWTNEEKEQDSDVVNNGSI